jgi:hypothetical protein
LTELLLILACAQGACSTVGPAYLKQKPGVEAQVEVLQRRYEDYTKPVAPLLPLAAGRLKVKTLGADLQVSEDRATLNFTWRF